MVVPTKDVDEDVRKDLDSRDIFRISSMIKKYGKKLDIFEYKQCTKSTTIFEELVRIYDRKKITIPKIKELSELAIAEGCWFDDDLIDYCLERGKPDLVSIFIKLFKDPKKMHFDTGMRWIYSARNNNERLEIVRFLLDEMEIPILNGKSDDLEFTLLHIACDLDDYELVKYLIEKGADPNLPNTEKTLPIGITRCLKITDLLLKNGSAVNSSGYKME